MIYIPTTTSPKTQKQTKTWYPNQNPHHNCNSLGPISHFWASSQTSHCLAVLALLALLSIFPASKASFRCRKFKLYCSCDPGRARVVLMDCAQTCREFRGFEVLRTTGSKGSKGFKVHEGFWESIFCIISIPVSGIHEIQLWPKLETEM